MEVTAQKICRVCRDARDIRSVSDTIWTCPSKAEEVLDETMCSNESIFEFENELTE